MEQTITDARAAAKRWGCAMAVFHFGKRLHYCPLGCQPASVEILRVVEA